MHLHLKADESERLDHVDSKRTLAVIATTVPVSAKMFPSASSFCLADLESGAVFSWECQLTAKEKRRPKHVQCQLSVVKLECLIGLRAKPFLRQITKGKKYSRPPRSNSRIESPGGEVGSVTHQTV